ncbi:MAG: helix-turn-helix domain-containing protein [Oscillospiraceae bacterium]|nr:helix-turn-helix domain-containing protein [Oscillospiraceae bacterium]
MEDPVFNSSLTQEEISKNFEGVDFFTGLMEGLQEAVSYTKGNPSKETTVRKLSLPEVNVVEIRKSLDMTQRAFASILGVSCRTVESWEIGRSTPTPTAKKLLFLIQEDHSLVEKLG